MVKAIFGKIINNLKINKMYHFDILAQAIILREVSEDNHSLTYTLKIPRDEEQESTLYLTDKQIIYIAILLTDWKNTTGRTASFKEVIRKFTSLCKQAEKLKI